LLQLQWKQKSGDLKKIEFLSSNFMKLCRNIHRSVWQILGIEKNQNGGRCHGNKGAKNVKFTPNHMAYDIPTRFHQV
jgi:hypothetical protein